ncbi:MAG: metal-dependent hydrolase [Pseudomonadota bacterium]
MSAAAQVNADLPVTAAGKERRQHPTPAAVAPLRHRRTQFEFTDVPRYWADGDAFFSRFIDALSINFPDGERFFMDSVRRFEKQVQDPKLLEDIRTFIRQEAQHGFAHEQFNAHIQAQGVRADRVVKILKKQKAWAQRKLSPKWQLAFTAAAEHLTATLGEGMLELMPERLRTAHPEMRALYFWHAVEEVEHKAVAFDTYRQATDGGYTERAVAMVVFTLWLHVKVAEIMTHAFRVDGISGDRTMIARGIWNLYGPRGFLTRLLPRYLAWFKPGFHPFDTTLPPLAQAWIDEYEKHHDPIRACAVAYGERPAL